MKDKIEDKQLFIINNPIVRKISFFYTLWDWFSFLLLFIFYLTFMAHNIS